MSSAKGGYKIINFGGVSISSTPVEIPGITEQISKSVFGKALLLSGVKIGVYDMDEAFSSIVVDEDDNINLYAYGGKFTITDEDMVSFQIDELKEIEDDISDLQTDSIATRQMIAPIETDVTSASQGYAIGEQFILDGLLCEATAIILEDDSFVLNENYKLSPSVTEQINTLKKNNPYIIDTGYVDIAREAGVNEQAVTFAQVFTSTPNVFLSIQTTEPDRFFPQYADRSSTGFTARVYNTGTSITGTVRLIWVAIGN